MMMRTWNIAATWAILAAGAAAPVRAQLPPQPELPPLPAALEERASPPAGGPRLFSSSETQVGRLEVKLGQGKLLILAESLEAAGAGQPTIAVGDPNVADFVVIGTRRVRVIGRRLGVTDLALTTAAGRTESVEVRVVADLLPLEDLLKRSFSTAHVVLQQAAGQVIVEGEARDAHQASRIIETVGRYIQSLQDTSGGSAPSRTTVLPGAGLPVPPAPVPAEPEVAPADNTAAGLTPMNAGAGAAPVASGSGSPVALPVVNLLRVPGPQQVLLKVRIAELNRTALRQIGGDVLGIDRKTGAILGTQIGGSIVTAEGTAARRLTGAATAAASPLTTAFGILQEGNVEFLVSALRRNSLLKILAEPNLMAENGRQASFLAGGEFPVPVPQIASSGVAPTITVQFKKFGVQLDFLPTVLEEEVIRLTVDPVVSTIDRAIGTTLVAGGTPVPGLNTRQAHTTVDLRPGQTLAIAGLLQLTLDGQTSRIPGLGDLPVLGPFFSNTTSQRMEKELLVLVTPYLVEPMNPGEVPPTPGDEVGGPSDFEFYFLNRIEGRVGKDYRSTTNYPDPMFLSPYFRLEKAYLKGPFGFSP